MLALSETKTQLMELKCRLLTEYSGIVRQYSESILNWVIIKNLYYIENCWHSL